MSELSNLAPGKQCIKCGAVKDTSEFYPRKRGKNGVHSACKTCATADSLAWRKANPGKTKASREKAWANRKARRKANPGMHNAYQRAWRKVNPGRVKVIRERAEARRETRNKANPGRVKAIKKAWQRANRERINQNRINRCKTDIGYGIACSLRTQFRIAFKSKGLRKKGHVLELLGMSVPNFLAYIAAKFDEGMNWENHGTVWEYDHIKPIASFDLADPEQQKACFHYSNYQPLSVSDNRSKRAKLDWCKTSCTGPEGNA